MKLQPQTYAVIVGVGEYKDPKIKARETADADAKAFYDVFTNKKSAAFPPITCNFCSPAKTKNERPSRNQGQILAAFKKLAEQATANDRALVIWVGNGASVGDHLFFRRRFDFKDRAKDAFMATELEAEFKAVKAKEVVAMLDLDLKGFDADKKEPVLEPNIMDFVRVFMGVKEKDEAEPPAGRVIILAGSGTNPVVTVDGKEGIFAKAVIDGLHRRRRQRRLRTGRQRDRRRTEQVPRK